MKNKFLVLVLGVLILVGGFYFSSTVVFGATAPTVNNPIAINITASSATLGGTIVSLGVPAQAQGNVCYGLSETEMSCSQTAGIITKTGPFTIDVSGLKANTTYYYFAAAANGQEGKSVMKTFKTLSSSPAGMSGTLSASDCTIPLNANSCNISVNWSVSNPVNPLTKVTTPTNISVGTGHTGPATYSITSGPGTKNFFLYNNAEKLAEDSIDVSCASGTWVGGKCTAGSSTTNPSGTLTGPTSCVVSAGQNSCTITLNWLVTNRPSGQDGTWISDEFLGSVAQTGNSGTQTVTVPSGGKTFNLRVGTRISPFVYTDLAQFTVSTSGGGTPPPPTGNTSGTLTPDSASCQIVAGQSSCSVNLNWTVSNIQASSKPLVYVGGAQVCDGRYSSCSSGSTTISFSTVGTNSVNLEIGRTISPQLLEILDTSTVAVSAPAMSGTITASNCTIPAGGSSCSSNLIWSTTNPIGTSEVTTTPPDNTSVAFGNSDSATYSVGTGPSSRTFYLYNSAQLLNQATATAACVAGTAWNNGICSSNQVTLTVDATDGDGSGTVVSSDPGIDCGYDCTQPYNPGEFVTLIATPASGSSFAGWSGSCSGYSGAMITIPISSSGTCTATFNSGSGGPVTGGEPGGSCGTCGNPSSRGASYGYDRQNGCAPGITQGQVTDGTLAWTWTCGSSQCFEIKPFGGFQNQ